MRIHTKLTYPAESDTEANLEQYHLQQKHVLPDTFQPANLPTSFKPRVAAYAQTGQFDAKTYGQLFEH